MFQGGLHLDISSQRSVSSRMSDIGTLFCTPSPSFSSSATTTESLPRLLIFTITKQATYVIVYITTSFLPLTLRFSLPREPEVKRIRLDFQGSPSLGLQFNY